MTLQLLSFAVDLTLVKLGRLPGEGYDFLENGR